MQFIIYTSIVLIFTLAFSYIPISINFDSTFYNTLFTVIGIFYSIGYSIALGFNFDRIQNDEFSKRIKKEIKKIIKLFTICLFISAILFLLSNAFVAGSNPALNFFHYGYLKFSPQIFFAASLLFCLIFLVYNFTCFQKLKDDLEEKIKDENTD
jgi:hypothetical protein